MYNDISTYFKATFNLNVAFSTLSVSLPWAVKHMFQAATIKINQIEFLALVAKENSDLDEHALIVTKLAIKAVKDKPVIVFATKKNRYFERQAVKYNFGFVVPSNYCYIPTLLLHAGAAVDNKHKSGSSKLGVLATMITISFLEGRTGKCFTSAELNLNASKPAMSRALRELENNGIISINRNQRTHKLTFKKDRMFLWSHRVELFSSVCSEPMPVHTAVNKHDHSVCNISALSEYSNLSRPERLYGVFSLASEDRLHFPVSDTTLNSIAEMYLKKENLYYDNYYDDSRLQWAQVFPYPPTVNRVNNKSVLSPIFTYLSTTILEPRTVGALHSVESLIIKELSALDTQDLTRLT